MSEQQQPKEYIITEEQLHNLVHGNAQLCLVMEKEVRSRPHPAPGTLQKVYEGAFDEGLEIGKAQCETHHKEMRDEAARQAREDVLKTFTKLWRDNYCPEPKKACHADDGKDYCPICILKESLRIITPHTEQEQPR